MNPRQVSSTEVCRETLLLQEIFGMQFLKHLGNDLLRPEFLMYQALRDAEHTSSKEVLSVYERRLPCWFNESQQLLMAAIAARNQAQLEFNRKCKSGDPKPHPEDEILQSSRTKLNLMVQVAAAKNSRMADKITGFGQGNKHPKTDWDCVNNIKQDLNGHSSVVSEQRFKNHNG